ncbi:MAG: alpha-2-macroglobulin family protein [Tenacibaculum sp.]
MTNIKFSDFLLIAIKILKTKLLFKFSCIKTIIILLAIGFYSNNLNAQQSYRYLWDKVYKFEIDKFQKSALKTVDEIYKKAKKDKNAPQIIKCLFYKSKFLLELEEDAQLKIIDQFKKHITKSSFPTKNVLENILANLYWQYFNENRWRFYKRTQSSTIATEDDFRTWDLNTLFAKIHSHFKASLQQSEDLQKISIFKFLDILELTKDTKTYQPSLFDFLAHNSLNFYKSSETSINKPAYSFIIDNKTYLVSAPDFCKLELSAKDSLSLQFKTLKVYRQLIRFHLASSNLEAMAANDIARLKFIDKHSNFSHNQKQLLQVLKTSENLFKNHKASALYAYEIAKIHSEPNKSTKPNNKKALAICNKTISAFPKSTGAAKCRALKNLITSKKLTILAEKHIPTEQYSKILVNFKNINTLYLSTYAISFSQLNELNKIYNTAKQFEFISKLKQVERRNFDLKNNGDYLQQSTEVSLPKFYQGFFLILATPDKKPTKKSIFAYSTIQATDIAFITKHNQKNNYQVVDRNTGMPLPNAKVHFTNIANKHYQSTLDKHFFTDKNGEFSFIPTAQYYKDVSLTITYKNQTASFKPTYINKSQNKETIAEKPRIKTFIFTDRNIYRPGQIIYLKGICTEAFKNKAFVKTDKTVLLRLKDANFQTVKELTIKTNELGSFSSNFTIPKQGITGNFTIETSVDNKVDYTQIWVEQYKRPKFKIHFTPVVKAVKINEKIMLNGSAKAYSGASISSAKVVYRVYRKVSYPIERYAYIHIQPGFSQSSQEITHGETTTDKHGNFSLTFKTLPDQSANPESFPVFNYIVNVDITDFNGETNRSSTEIKAGYHSLITSVKTPKKINKELEDIKFKINTLNLNGEFVPSAVNLKIFKLKAPTRVFRKRPWAAPNYQIIPEDEFKKKFPYDTYANKDNYTNREKENLIFASKFNTANKKELNISSVKKWASGKYIIVLESTDKLGKSSKVKNFFSLYSTEDKLPADKQLFSISSDKNLYKPGDTALVKLSTNSENLHLILRVEKRKKTVEKHYIHLSKNHKNISIPITQHDVGGFALQWHFVNYNSFEKGSFPLKVAYPNNKLLISTQTFKDKLQPGEKQTWSFKIQKPNKTIADIELLASMYDASLDAFAPQLWHFKPLQNTEYYSRNNTKAALSFQNTQFTVQNINNHLYLPSYKLLRAKYNWFGFNLSNWHWLKRNYLKNVNYQRSQFQSVLSGVVKNKAGALPGVKVWIKDTQFGTKTDREGKFNLKVNKNDILMFSLAGMKTIEKTINQLQDIILIEMESAYNLEPNNAIETEAVYTNGKSRILLAPEHPSESAPVSYKNKVAKEDAFTDNKQFKGVKVRKNFNETAFFYPHLRSDKNGDISFSFTVPDALTTWKLQLLAHSKDLFWSTKTLEALTQKKLMISPNIPRFLRQGDQISLSTKITNLSDKDLTGKVQLILKNPLTGKEVNLLNKSNKTQAFSIKQNKNTSVSWSLSIPKNLNALQYKIVAEAGSFSDGQQNTLLVLSNKTLVTESMPMWIKGNKSKTFSLDKLKNNKSVSLKNHQLSLEISSNPAWYAIQALPYLMEYPSQSSEQVFVNYYAYILGSHIVNSSPKIQQVFKQWENSNALMSNLEKNQELKSLVIKETPWLRSAQSESEQKKRIALLFDLNNLQNHKQNALNKLKELQMSSGGFPWFKGAKQPNSKITLQIASGFGHLKWLHNIDADSEKADTIIKKAVQFLDNEIADIYKTLLKKAEQIKQVSGSKKGNAFLKKNNLSSFIIQYLYMRSFYNNIKISKKNQKAISYYIGQTSNFWKYFNLHNKGLSALILHRSGKIKTANKILQSLRETSVVSEKFGMYWKTNRVSWQQQQSPIETQALLIEAFTEIENDLSTVDRLKIWLLKNKQVKHWETAKASTEAIYALLLQGSNDLLSTELVTAKIGNKTINPMQNPDIKTEAGIGYYKISWEDHEISPEMAEVTLSSKSNNSSWGSLYWQYFENLNNISSASNFPVKLDKRIFKKINTDTGEKLVIVKPKETLELGTLLTIRIELSSDRDMEFVHLKDMRASGVEPIEVLSEYQWQDGLNYYQSTQDVASHFFFEQLPKGVYVFQYDVRVNNSGIFSSGIATVQSVYAPEFISHSKDIKLRIKE